MASSSETTKTTGKIVPTGQVLVKYDATRDKEYVRDFFSREVGKCKAEHACGVTGDRPVPGFLLLTFENVKDAARAESINKDGTGVSEVRNFDKLGEVYLNFEEMGKMFILRVERLKEKQMYLGNVEKLYRKGDAE